MAVIISKEKNDIPQGFRNLTDDEIINDYLTFDLDGNCRVSKNEWILTFAAILAKDIVSLEKESPDCVMQKLQEIADEFDYYDTDGSKFLEYKEYKDIMLNNVLISI